MAAKKTRSKNFIIFVLIAVNTILISSWLYNKSRTLPVALEILNGCGQEGIASEFADRLQAFNVMRVENADHFDYPETRIIVRNKNIKKNLDPLTAALQIPEPKVVFIQDTKRLANVTLILGADYQLYLDRLNAPPVTE